MLHHLPLLPSLLLLLLLLVPQILVSSFHLHPHHHHRRHHQISSRSRFFSRPPPPSSSSRLFIWKGLKDIFKNPPNSDKDDEDDPSYSLDSTLSKWERYRGINTNNNKPPPPSLEEQKRNRYPLGITPAANLPADMDDLWREAWPTDACKDIMDKKEALNNGAGPPQPDALVRPFGWNDTLNTIFYKDASSWCPYCQSVWMMLEEKQMPYKIKRVNLLAYGEKPDWFYDLSGTGLLPVLEVDGKILVESVDICKFIDWWRGSENKRRMWPDRNDELHAVGEKLLDLERELFKWWFVLLFEGPEPTSGEAEFMATLQQVETALGTYKDGPWFLPGEEPGLVDCVFAPKIERIIASCLYWKGLIIRCNLASYPNINRWMDALDTRPSYAAFKSDYFNLVNSLEPLFGRAYGIDTPERKEVQAKIDGLHPTAWRLPVSVEEEIREYLPPQVLPTEVYARQAAAVRLIINHKRVPRYMLRALGTPGREYRSPLADPGNEVEPWLGTLPEVEAVYRYLVLALLRGRESVEPLLRQDLLAADAAYVSKKMNEQGGEEKEKKEKEKEEVVTAEKARRRMVVCLEYLKVRVGVPRDMTLPEARQLRGHINWMVSVLR